MVEGGVDHRVGRGRGAGQAVLVVQVAAHRFGARRLQRPHAGFGAAQPQHLVAVRDQFLNDGRPDEAGRAGNENTHGSSPGI
ncbi:hypothetical protein D3C86_2105510 [compost metagenome]